MNRPSARWLVIASTVLALGFSVTAGDKKRLQRASDWPAVDLSGYDTVFVEDAKMTDPRAEDRKIQDLVKSAERRVADFVAYSVDREMYSQVHRRAAEPGEDGLVLRIEIPEYQPGSRAARFMMAGTGQAKLDLDIALLDAASGRELTRFTEERNFAWGGFLGAGKGITSLEQKAARELGAYLSLSHGMDPETVLERLKNPTLLGPPDRPHSTIYIIRPQGSVGAASTFRIGVDDTSIGESVRLRYHIAYVSPGEHFVWMASGKKRKGERITVAEGEDVYFMAMGMKRIEPKTGRKKLPKCRLSWEVDLTGEPAADRNLEDE